MTDLTPPENPDRRQPSSTSSAVTVWSLVRSLPNDFRFSRRDDMTVFILGGVETW